MSGDFDVRAYMSRGTQYVDWEISDFDLELYNTHDTYCTGTVDGVVVQHSPNRFYAYKCVNGAYSDITGVDSTDDAVWFRITRATNTYTMYYSADGISYTTLKTLTDANIAGAMYPTFENEVELTGHQKLRVDDFYIASGTTTFRTAGDWTSPAFTVPGGNAFNRIDLAFSGLSANAYIDRVEVLQGGAVLEAFEADIASGTSATLSPTLGETGELSLRVYLRGDGASSPAVESVSASWSPTGPGGVPIHGVAARLGYVADGFRVEYYDRSVSDYPVANRTWVLGDGSTSHEANPVHTYAFSDLWRTYRVTLTACNSENVCDTVQVEVTLVNWPLLAVLTSLVLIALLAAGALASRRRRRRA